ncbi:hypothetical protein FZEAL_3804 [Fusarium zealandicum]|uniref:Uncharacterized protein n=1 Tax=Fusarium zealandicum TaxID=1053134 RepID=A0A8H4UNQ7_9HYPO|nr:hypothetical protein FZEAL_3804 [Fusarium zealandicum]
MMGKFSFPGRKKQPPKVTVTAPPMSKAQKILGSTALNIDAPHQWDDFSSSKVSVAATEMTNAPSYASSAYGNSKYEREWGDESEIVPRQFRSIEAPTDQFDHDLVSDMTSIIRKRQSSSTLHSWYDKTKQPLSISQQTSNSAMAKGLPSKAQRMLDMDHAMGNQKLKKKKPTKLDLSHLIGRSRSNKNDKKQWDGPILGADQVVQSPSVLSPTSTTSLRGKLSKRPTKESLRSMHSESNRTETSDSSTRRGHNHLNGLPNLYEHYEQMSFRQVLDESECEERELDKQNDTEPHQSKAHTTQNAKHDHRPLPQGYLDERIVSQYAERHLPQTPQAILASKGSQSSPTNCAASVSSRHTRTSKASKRTDRSFQESDLQEKSVLSLSSDSEEDDVYIETTIKSSASVPEYAASDVSSIDYRPTTSRTCESADNSSKHLSRSSKWTSFTPSTNNFLTIPNGHHKSPATNARSSSLSGSSTNTIQEGTAAHSPLRNSNSSAMSWQSKPDFGLQQAKAVTMQSIQGPSDSPAESEQEKEADSENDLESEGDILHARKYVPRDSVSVTSNADQPTPPLSPSSVDFYIRSAHSSVDGKGSHNRFMAVTRQEEMLLAALRHKRQIMRESILSEMDGNVRSENILSKGHQSKVSEATITESMFEYDFPAPPTCKDKTIVSADGTTVIDLGHGENKSQPGSSSSNSSATSPAPTQLSTKKAHAKPRGDHHQQHEHILLYLDHPLVAEHPIEEAEPSPDLSDFYGFEDESEAEFEIASEAILHAQQRCHNSTHRPGNSKRSLSRPHHASGLSLEEDLAEAGVPRPDSPISPDALSPDARRPTVNKKTARLSAVGPAKWGYED